MRASLPVLTVLLIANAVWAESPAISPPSAAPASDVVSGTYPRAQWRVNPSALNDVAFMIQRIVISHAAASGEPQVFYPDAPARRSHAQALALARTLAKQAQQEPAAFSDLAKRHSDDSVTRSWGGLLGLTRATMLGDNVVDALAVLAVGQVSEPIETPQGVQIIKRLPVPADEAVSGRAIYIRHREVQGASASSNARSRLQAGQLAELIAGEAQLGADFDGLFARYAEQEDRSQAGDTGVLRVYAASADALLTYALSRAEVGAIIGPIETRQGFVVLKRTVTICRERLATREWVFRHRDSRPRMMPTDRGRAEAAAEALRVIALSRGAQTDEQAIELCRRHGCRVERRNWAVGERPAALEVAVRSIELGERLAEPIETIGGFYVLRRVAAEEPALPRLYFDVPQPRAKSYADLLRVAGGRYLARMTWAAAQEFVRESGLEGEKAGRFVSVMRSLADALANSADVHARAALAASARVEISAILGVSQLEVYERFVDERLAFIQRHL